MIVYSFPLSLSSLQTNTDIFPNSADPDLIRIYTICRSVIDFRLKCLFAMEAVSIHVFRNQRVHLKKSGVKGLNSK